MKLGELLLIIQNHMKLRDSSDLIVAIKTCSPSVGPSSSVTVDRAWAGMDWDRNTFFIGPSIRLVEKSENEDVFDMARDLLMYLATTPTKRPSYAIRQARRILKKTGMTEDDFVKYAKFFHRDKIEGENAKP